MASIPQVWHNCIVLLQNELLPRDWKAHNISNPTVISVWFEKKPGRAHHLLIPSRVHDPKAELISESLKNIGIPCKILFDEEELLYELVLKNVLVLAINIAGIVLAESAATEILWAQHNELAHTIAAEVIDVQEWLTGATFPRKQLFESLAEGIYGDPRHKCRGRAAQGRLARVLEIANEAGLEIPRIRAIGESLL